MSNESLHSNSLYTKLLKTDSICTSLNPQTAQNANAAGTTTPTMARTEFNRTAHGLRSADAAPQPSNGWVTSKLLVYRKNCHPERSRGTCSFLATARKRGAPSFAKQRVGTTTLTELSS